MKKFLVSEESSLKKFTDDHCAQASFCFRALLKEREIKVNGKKVSHDAALFPGDEVCYYLTPARAQKRAFTKVYEDDRLLIVDKESGVNSEAVFAETGLLPVHRLDRNTEGLLLVAKTEEAQAALLAAFREGRVEKEYRALVVGRMPKQRAEERAYLEKDEARATVRIFSAPGKDRVPILTEYEVLEERGECTLLKIFLHTGKTHQIRAHMAFLGHPVAGDGKYGDAAFNERAHLGRQKLLAKAITLRAGGILADLDGKTFFSQKNL